LFFSKTDPTPSAARQLQRAMAMKQVKQAGGEVLGGPDPQARTGLLRSGQ
jgi:hypothetical protein